MNQAAIKYTKISAAKEVKFTGSNKTITKDIIRMTADSTHRQWTPSQSTHKSLNLATNQTDNKSQANSSEEKLQLKPPIHKHYKSFNEMYNHIKELALC